MIIDVALLNALYSVRIFGKQTIAKHIAKRLNVTVRTALRRINRLENEKGLKFSIEYSLRALKLKRVAIFMTSSIADTALYDVMRLKDVVPFIRSIMTLLPLGLGMVYHLPEDVPIESLKVPSDAHIVIYQEFFRNMTDLNIYPLRSLYDARLASSDVVLHKLRERILNLFRNSTECNIANKAYLDEFQNFSSLKFDWIDLMIIKELEKDPFIGLESLSKKLNMPMSRVRRHLSKHVSRINRGIRIRKMPFDRLSDVVKLIMVFKLNDTIIAHRFINELIRCPLIIVCGLNVETSEVLVQAIPSVVDVRRVVRFFSDLSNELGFDFRNFFIAVSSRSYTVPFIRDKEYTPAVGWRFKERSS